jgi:hypothetical protein
MKAIERTVYHCGFCKKYYLQRYAAERHETYCAKNPVNRHACFDCIYLSVEREVNDGFSEKTFTCTKLDKQMHSFKAERIEHSCLAYTDRMPLQCDDRKTEVDKYFADQKGIQL